jgi:acyl-CoA oxidase
MPGIEVGDMGPKIGYEGKDNGYLIFDKVSIPRTNLLSRYTKVDKQG